MQLIEKARSPDECSKWEEDDAEGWEDAKQKLQNLFSIQSPRAGEGSCVREESYWRGQIT